VRYPRTPAKLASRVLFIIFTPLWEGREDPIYSTAKKALFLWLKCKNIEAEG
jgi:hypothetical protein